MKLPNDIGIKVIFPAIYIETRYLTNSVSRRNPYVASIRLNNPESQTACGGDEAHRRLVGKRFVTAVMSNLRNGSLLFRKQCRQWFDRIEVIMEMGSIRCG